MQAHICWQSEKQWFAHRWSYGNKAGLWLGDLLLEEREKHCSYPLLHLLFFISSLIFILFFLIPWGEGWMHSTCFLQNSCMHTSCSHSSLPTSFSQSTCCGCLVGFSTPEAFQATHIPIISPSSFVYRPQILISLVCYRDLRIESVFWIWLAWLPGGLGSQSEDTWISHVL